MEARKSVCLGKRYDVLVRSAVGIFARGCCAEVLEGISTDYVITDEPLFLERLRKIYWLCVGFGLADVVCTKAGIRS